MQTPQFTSRLTAMLALAALSLPFPTWAALPAVDAPTRGAGGGILTTLQNYGFDIVMLIGLILVAALFIGVAYHAYVKDSLINQGKATWGEFGLVVAVGVALLVLGIWLVTKATEVL
jgi:integrating conjugative element membrane protein (TIGR03745 family)